MPGTVDNTAFFGTAARRLDGMASAEYSGDHTSSIRREPIGVVGSIAPWNYPLQMAAWKVLPAIAAGNTIVLKPAEITPLTSIRLRRGVHRGRRPRRCRQRGHRHRPGRRPAPRRPPRRRDDLASPGSTNVGRQVMATASATGKRVHLELGGKAPFVVFDDADLEAAIHGAVAASLINAGQDCTAATRAIVHRSVHDAFVTGVADLMAAVRIGPTADEATDLGPLSSPAHQAKVAGMVERARGYAKVVTGGADPHRRPRPRLLLRADPGLRRAARLRDLARRGLRAGARGRGVRRRRRGDRAGQRHRVRAGRLGLDPRHLPRRPRHPRDQGRLRVGQRPHPDHQRDAARRLPAQRLRQGHVGLLVRRVHQRQARHARQHRRRAQAVAPHHLHPPRPDQQPPRGPAR